MRANELLNRTSGSEESNMFKELEVEDRVRCL